MGWFVPLRGEGAADGVAWRAGECLIFEGRTEISASADSDVLFAYPGDKRI
jgi:mannose-6-phosphate isomerase